MDGVLIPIVLLLAGAAFVQSFSGFGMALVAIAALPMLMDVREAIALITVFNLLVTITTLVMNWRGFRFRGAGGVIVGFVVGIPLGYYFLQGLDERVVIRVLGAALVGLAVFEIAMLRRGHLALPKWMGGACGLTGGVLGGAFNTGGPPIVAYVYSQDWSKAQIVATLQVAFLCGGLFRTSLMAVEGEHSVRIWTIVAWAALPTLFSVWMGYRMLGRVSLRWLRYGVFVFLLAMGLKYLMFP
ncbi:MAG: sulfite exporter TauE/SafE family protein [Verrucomicrobiota bacterium]